MDIVYLVYQKYPEVNQDFQVLMGAFRNKQDAIITLGNPEMRWCIDPNKWISEDGRKLIHAVKVR